MAIENDDPFSQLSQQGGLGSNKKNDDHDVNALFESHHSEDNATHSDTHEEEFGKGGGHMSGEEEDPEKDALNQYANSVGGWFVSGAVVSDDKGSTTNKNNQTAQDNLNPIQKEQLRHQQNMNKLEETNKGLETSANMLSTFQQNADTALGLNANTAEIAKENLAELKDYLQGVTDELLDEKAVRKKTSPEDADEVFAKLNWLKVRINEDMKTYRKYEDTSRRWALTFRLLSSMLAAVVTVLLGLNITDYMKSYGIDWFVNFFALLISAFISIIGVIQGFFDVNELYIKYTDTANKLEELQEMMEYLELSKNYVTLRQTNLLYRAYNKIITSTHEYEMRVRADNNDQKR